MTWYSSTFQLIFSSDYVQNNGFYLNNDLIITSHSSLYIYVIVLPLRFPFFLRFLSDGPQMTYAPANIATAAPPIRKTFLASIEYIIRQFDDH